jgi:hypothetical protein
MAEFLRNKPKGNEPGFAFWHPGRQHYTPNRLRFKIVDRLAVRFFPIRVNPWSLLFSPVATIASRWQLRAHANPVPLK